VSSGQVDVGAETVSPPWAAPLSAYSRRVRCCLVAAPPPRRRGRGVRGVQGLPVACPLSTGIAVAVGCAVLGGFGTTGPTALTADRLEDSVATTFSHLAEVRYQ
jgi:hypothetical protein